MENNEVNEDDEDDFSNDTSYDEGKVVNIEYHETDTFAIQHIQDDIASIRKTVKKLKKKIKKIQKRHDTTDTESIED
jgi:hypothetical protein